MTTPDSPPSLVLDDDWQPPALARRFPLVLVASVVIIACVILAAIIAAVWTFDQARFIQDPEAASYSPDTSESPWSPIASAPVAAFGEPEASANVPPRRPAPSRTGYLAVNSTPWAELSVDGRVVGNTPQLSIQVPPGRHELVFRREGFGTERRRVSVSPGATVRVTDITLSRSAP
jgi:hypothetical protein